MQRISVWANECICLFVHLWGSVTCVPLLSWCRIIYRTEISFSIQDIHIHTNTNTHMSIVGPEKISSWSHRYRVCLNIHEFEWMCVCVCAWVCRVGEVWVKENKTQLKWDRELVNILCVFLLCKEECVDQKYGNVRETATDPVHVHACKGALICTNDYEYTTNTNCNLYNIF